MLLWIIEICVIVACICYFLVKWLVFDQRHWRSIRARPLIPFEVWYQKYYNCPELLPQSDVADILDYLGSELRVSPTQLLPTDRLEFELRLHDGLFDTESTSCYQDLVNELLVMHHRSKVLPTATWKSMDDLIRGYVACIPQGKPDIGPHA